MSRPPLMTVVGTGDIVLTRALADAATDPSFAATHRRLLDADLVVSSLEIAFSDRGAPSDRILNFRARPELVSEVSTLGVDLVTLANNHSSDYGWTALADTLAALDRVGVAHVGAGDDLSHAEQAHIVERNGLRVGYLAWSCLLPTGIAAGQERPGVAPIHVHTRWDVNSEFQMEEPGVPPTVRTWVEPADLARVQANIATLRERTDVVLVGVHWGFGFGNALAEYQRPLGHALIDAGADVVLGHHVHCPQGVEEYRGKVIVYSHGNFVAQQPREGISEEIAAIYRAFSRDAMLSEIAVFGPHDVEVSLVPQVTNADGLPSQAFGREFDAVLARVTRESAELGTRIESRNGRLVVAIPELSRRP